MRIIWQTVRRITNEILGVKGLIMWLIDVVLRRLVILKRLNFPLNSCHVALRFCKFFFWFLIFSVLQE